MSWCFQDETNDYAVAIRQSMRRNTARVPAIWPYEVANVLIVGERRGRLTRENSMRFLALISALPIEIDPFAHIREASSILEVAGTANLSAYDAAYLDLAMRSNLPLATLDARLSAVAPGLGVRLFTLPSPA